MWGRLGGYYSCQIFKVLFISYKAGGGGGGGRGGGRCGGCMVVNIHARILKFYYKLSEIKFLEQSAL